MEKGPSKFRENKSPSSITGKRYCASQADTTYSSRSARLVVMLLRIR